METRNKIQKKRKKFKTNFFIQSFNNEVVEQKKFESNEFSIFIFDATSKNQKQNINEMTSKHRFQIVEKISSHIFANAITFAIDKFLFVTKQLIQTKKNSQNFNKQRI